MAKSQDNGLGTTPEERHHRFHVLVIGAGIGGLSLAILRAQDGHQISIIERRRSYDGISSGGGINLTSNAIRCLDAMGIGESMRKIAEPVRRTLMRRYATGKTIAARQSTPPHVMVHRHDLLMILYRRAVALGVKITFEARIERIDLSSASPVVFLQDGSRLSAEIVVGADGVNSMARKTLFPGQEVTASPTSDCVFLIDVPGRTMRRHEATRPLCSDADPPYHLWLGPGRSVVAWYMSSRDVYHLQMCEHEYAQGAAYGISEDEPFVAEYCDMERFRARWSDFAESMRTIVDSATTTTKWRIASVAELPTWTGSHGRLVLLGDAAHAFPPFAGQGAAMAIEDAACLATLMGLARSLQYAEKVAAVYEAIRRPRVDRISRVVKANTAMFALHDGPAQVARDDGLRQANSSSEAQLVPDKALRSGADSQQRRRQPVEEYDAIEEARKGWRIHQTKL